MSSKQQQALEQFLDLLGRFALIKDVQSTFVLGALFIQASLEVDGIEGAINFFVPTTGRQVYRYGEDKRRRVIHLNEEAVAIAALDWIALLPDPKMSQI
jgi:hypothetical protein